MPPFIYGRRSSSGSLAMLAAMRRALSSVIQNSGLHQNFRCAGTQSIFQVV
jgi:hypothetical protein